MCFRFLISRIFTLLFSGRRNILNFQIPVGAGALTVFHCTLLVEVFYREWWELLVRYSVESPTNQTEKGVYQHG